LNTLQTIPFIAEIWAWETEENVALQEKLLSGFSLHPTIQFSSVDMNESIT
jgi:hypothetical protein